MISEAGEIHKKYDESETVEQRAHRNPLNRFVKSRGGRWLRGVLAAGMIGAAQPAISEDSSRAEAVNSQAFSGEQFKSLDERDARLLRMTVRGATAVIESEIKSARENGGGEAGSFIEVYKNQLAQIRANENNLQYAEGLLRLNRVGDKVDLSSIALHISPELIKNKYFVDERIGNIPEVIRDKFKIGWLEFSTSKDYDPAFYSGRDFLSIAKEMGDRGLMEESSALRQIMRLGKNREVFYDAFKFLNDNGISFCTEIMWGLSEEGARDSDFQKILAEMNQKGVYVRHLFGLSPAESISPEAVKDTDYMSAFWKLKDIGVTEYGLKNRLSLDIVKGSNFVNNFLELVDKKILTVNDFIGGITDIVSDSLVVKRSIELNEMGYRRVAKELFTPSGFISAMSREEYASDDYFRGLKYFAEHHVKLEGWELSGFSIGRAKSQRYLDLLVEQANLGEGFAKADSIYVKEETGEDLEEVVNEDLKRFSELQKNEKSTQALKDILKSNENLAFLNFVLKMSRKDTQENRLRDLEGIDARTKFRLLATVGEHGWPSTRNLIYDGYHVREDSTARKFALVEDIRREYGNSYEFLKQINPTEDELNNFLGRLAEMGKVGSFYELASNENRDKLASEFLLGLEKADDQRGKVGGLVESLRVLKWGEGASVILAGVEKEKNRLQGEIEKIINEDKGEGDLEKMKDAMLWYELVAASYYKKHGDAPRSEWASDMVDQYGEMLPEFKRIPESKMFPGGVHVRYNLFFNTWDQEGVGIQDRDGHKSLASTLKRFGGHVDYDKEGNIVTARGGSNGWKIELKRMENWDYVELSKVDEKSGRKIVNIMNSPKMNNDEIVEFYKYMYGENVDEEMDTKRVSGFVMRGHNIKDFSDTSMMVFENIINNGNGDMPYVNFGSCGGFKSAEDILALSNSSFFSSTQGTGTMYVNEIIQQEDMEWVLEHGYYDSERVKERVDKIFAKLKESKDPYEVELADRYESYRWPHENGVAQVYAAFNTLKVEEGE